MHLTDGKRKWKGGRYGHGQLIVLPDQDLLLVLSEEGELELVAAASDQFTEVARFPAIEGKTWNHPVLVGDVGNLADFHLRGSTRVGSNGVPLRTVALQEIPRNAPSSSPVLRAGPVDCLVRIYCLVGSGY